MSGSRILIEPIFDESGMAIAPKKSFLSTVEPFIDRLIIMILSAVLVMMLYNSWVKPLVIDGIRSGNLKVCRDPGKPGAPPPSLPGYSLYAPVLEKMCATAHALKQGVKNQTGVSTGAPGATNPPPSEEMQSLYEQERNWRKMAAWYISHKELARNMSPEMVTSSWGRPTARVSVMKNGSAIERWEYGDPLYGIPLTDRHADFQDGGLTYFSTNKILDDLYLDILNERGEADDAEQEIFDRR